MHDNMEAVNLLFLKTNNFQKCSPENKNTKRKEKTVYIKSSKKFFYLNRDSKNNLKWCDMYVIAGVSPQVHFLNAE